MELSSRQRHGSHAASCLPHGVALLAILVLCTTVSLLITASAINPSGSGSNAFITTTASGDSSVHAGIPVNATRVGSEASRVDHSATKRFAYMFYVTSDQYACSALQLIDGLANRLGADTSSIDFVILHGKGISDRHLTQAREKLSVRTVHVDLMRAKSRDPTWKNSLTKLRVFQEWGYDRVVFLDSDAVAMQNLDHLFHLPSAPLYAPTAYWLPQPFFASTLMVIEPSNAVFDEMIAWANAQGSSAGYDMDILNAFFNTTARYLPGEYTVLNSDFRQPSDASNKLFNSTAELAINAKFVHFSCKPDGSYGKPWSWPRNELGLLDNSDFFSLFRELFVGYWEGEDRLCSH